ncbi:MAG TPA: divergent polysaccharide deacetylase family protein [bacterium]|nr:divergent polysaccharide deacetylase family protein [bacterium]
MARRRSTRRQSSHLVLGLIIGLIVGAGLTVGVLIAQHRGSTPAPARLPAARRTPTPPAPRPVTPRAHLPLPPRRNPEGSRGPAVVPAPPHPVSVGPGRLRVAIIFDDAGYSLRAAQEVEAIGRPVTISVLPHLPYSTMIAEEAPAHGVQVILHLPVEPDNQNLLSFLGEGGIRVAMTDGEIRQAVAGDLATVPTAVGANNHMGSLGTADPRVMHAVMEEMKAHHLFFVDSVTSSRTVAAQVARQIGVPTAARAVFLDNEDTEEYVRGQFRTLITLAHARGQAIAIGHVGKVTARVLISLLPEFDEAGIQLVRVSDLVH